jgi:hypothetical protein
MSHPIKPENLPEKLIWYYTLFTYPMYFAGGQFVVGPLLATFLTGYLLKKWWNQTEDTPPSEKITISPIAWAWVIAVLIIAVALVVGSLDFDWGIDKIISALIVWYRTWFVLALFPLVGHLKIRPKLIYRAVCILCLQNLIVTLIGMIAGSVGIPEIDYIAPLRIFGSGDIAYEVTLFQNPLKDRIFLYATWPTILGSLCNIYFCFALEESDKRWRWMGIFSSIFILVLTQGRTAIVALPFVLGFVWYLTHCIRPWVQFASGFISLLAGLYAPSVINGIRDFRASFDNARAGSSKVRNIVYEMTLERWWKDARIWGFGIRQEKGPEITFNVPLGTHHTWFGVLYSYGLVGCISLALVFLWTLIDLLIKTPRSENAKMGLKIFLILLISSFADTIEMFSYLYFPGLIVLGNAFSESLLTSGNSQEINIIYQSNKYSQ